MSWRNYPIKFYKNIKTDTVDYESGFALGSASTLENAFRELMHQDFARDLYYYFDDIVDVQIGRFIPNVEQKVRRGRIFLGHIECRIELDKHNGMNNQEKSITYLAKNKEALKKHLNWIDDMKNKETQKTTQSNEQTLINKIKNGITKVVAKLKGTQLDEMFTPVKSTTQLICEHCGRVIPIGTYYDTYKRKDYHLECLWDKLINKIDNNSYESAERFFWSLKEKIGNWPAYGFDVEEDYISDLELVKHNNRIIKRNPMEESIKSINETFEYWEKVNEKDI